MNYTKADTEAAIDLKDLCIYILKKWRILLVSMLAFAVLLSVYKGILKPGTITLSATEQKKIQDQIDANNKTIASYNASIQDNNNKIDTNNKTIEADSADLEIQKKLIDNLENIVASNNANSQTIDSLTTANIELAIARKKVYDYETEIETLKNQNNYLPTSNENLQQKVDTLNNSNESLKASLSPKASKASASNIIKYFIIGAVLGIFIICCIFFIRYVLCRKLNNSSYMREYYNIRTLGSIYTVPEKTRQTKFDKLLNKWSGYDKIIDKKVQYKLISSAIQVILNEGNRNIILTGTVNPDMLSQVENNLMEVLSGNNYQLRTMPNPVYDADSLLAIKNSTVVLIEAMDVSLKSEIDKLIDILGAGNAVILGTVII